MESRRDVYQAIADPTRREIISHLAEKPRNLNALAEKFHLTRQAISLHVKILQECGVIVITQMGRERICSVNPGKLAEVFDWLGQFRQLLENRFAELDELLTNLKEKDDEN